MLLNPSSDLTLEIVQPLILDIVGCPISEPLELNLAEVDIPNGTVMALLTRSLTERLKAGGRVHLVGPPQALAHNLYRTGLLEHAQLSIEDLRSDEAYAA